MKLIADSPYRHPLNTAVLKLQQSGLITELKKKWWTQKRGGGTCRVRTETNTRFQSRNEICLYLKAEIYNLRANA